MNKKIILLSIFSVAISFIALASSPSSGASTSASSAPLSSDLAFQGGMPLMPLMPQNVVVIPGMENKNNEITVGTGGYNHLDGSQVLVDLYKENAEKDASIYFHYGHDMPGLDANNQGVSLNAYYLDAKYKNWAFYGYNIGSTSYIPVSTLYPTNPSPYNSGTYPRQNYSVLESDSDLYLTNTLVKQVNYSSVAGLNYSSSYTNDENIIIPNAPMQDPYLGTWFCTSAFVDAFYKNEYKNVTVPLASSWNNHIKWDTNTYNDASMQNSTSVVRTNVNDVIHFNNNPFTVVTANVGVEYAKAIIEPTGTNTVNSTQNQINSKTGIELNQQVGNGFGFTTNVDQDSFNQPLKNYIIAFPFDYYITPMNVNTRQCTTSLGGSVYYKTQSVEANIKAENMHANNLIIYSADPLIPESPVPLYSVTTPIMLTNYNSPVAWNEYTGKVIYNFSPGVMTYVIYQYSSINNVPYQPKNMVNGGLNYLMGQNNIGMQMNYFEGMYAETYNQWSLAPIWTFNVQDSYALAANTTVILAINNLFNATPVFKPGYMTSGRCYSASLEYKF